MANKLRVGIVGAGNIAVSAHLPSYMELKDIVEVVAIADIVPERAKDAAFSLGVNREIDPFMTLSFMSLPVIPKLRLTTRGVLDVEKQQYV